MVFAKKIINSTLCFTKGLLCTLAVTAAPSFASGIQIKPAGNPYIREGNAWCPLQAIVYNTTYKFALPSASPQAGIEGGMVFCKCRYLGCLYSFMATCGPVGKEMNVKEYIEWLKGQYSQQSNLCVDIQQIKTSKKELRFIIEIRATDASTGDFKWQQRVHCTNQREFAFLITTSIKSEQIPLMYFFETFDI